jgi:hypothetical protein
MLYELTTGHLKIHGPHRRDTSVRNILLVNCYIIPFMHQTDFKSPKKLLREQYRVCSSVYFFSGWSTYVQKSPRLGTYPEILLRFSESNLFVNETR